MLPEYSEVSKIIGKTKTATTITIRVLFFSLPQEYY